MGRLQLVDARLGQQGLPEPSTGARPSVVPRLLALLGLLALVAPLLLVLGAGPRLTVVAVLREAPDGSVHRLLSLPAGRGETFVIAYTHSVNRFPIREELTVEESPDGERRLVVTGQAVKGDGAGIGEVPGETRWAAAPGGWQRLEGLRRVVEGPLVVRVGWIADHRLLYRGRDTALGDLAEGGARLVLRPIEVSPAEWLRARWTWHGQRSEATGDA
jgi:hypothetical protein